MPEFITQLVVPLLIAVLGSSGIWAFLDKRRAKKDWSAKMLLGLGHDRIMSLGMEYVRQGYVTRTQYEDLQKYLYTPYKGMGGNGSAERIMQEVNKLPLREDDM